jgi:hypothetical protein
MHRLESDWQNYLLFAVTAYNAAEADSPGSNEVSSQLRNERPAIICDE